jgi:hypothetical protein
VVAIAPVRGRRDLVLGRELHRVDDAQHFVEVTPGAHRVRDHQLDLLVGADHVDVPHRLVVDRGAPVARLAGLGRQHAVQLRHLQVGVRNHRVVGRMALRLFDVLRPAAVTLHRVHAQPDDLHVALLELGLDARHVAEFGGADGREVLRVREEDAPRITEPLVKPDGPVGRHRLEIWRVAADGERSAHAAASLVVRWRQDSTRRAQGAEGGKGSREARVQRSQGPAPLPPLGPTSVSSLALGPLRPTRRPPRRRPCG